MSGTRAVAVVLAVALAAPIVGVPGRSAAAPSATAPAEPDADAETDAETATDTDAPTDDAPAEDIEDPAGSGEIVDDPALDEPAPDDAPSSPPKPRRYVWGGTEIDAESSETPAPDTSAPPGGYLGPTETKEVAPKDGERKLLVAYIVLPLGTLAMVSGAVATWLTHPDHCQERLGRFGSDVSPKQCKGLWVLNIVRTTYGSMMVVSGAVLLGLGLRERKRYREWKAKHGAYVQPFFSRDRSGGGGDGQFGFVLGGRF